MSNIIQDIRPTGTSSAYVEAPFDEAKKILENVGFTVITAEQNAGLRIAQGKEAKVSTWGNYVKEGALYVPQKGRFITRGSLVMANPKQATNAHRKGEEFYIRPEQVEMVIGDSVSVPYDLTAVPTNRFGENEVTNFLFGKNAQKYGDFLKEAGKAQMPISFDGKDYVDTKGKPYANQVWLARLDDDSNVDGNLWNLNYDNTVRGVCLDAEGVAPSKLAEKTYTESQVLIAMKFAKGGLESRVSEFLRANN